MLAPQFFLGPAVAPPLFYSRIATDYDNLHSTQSADFQRREFLFK